MGDIYRFADITISAMSSKDGVSGIFQKRNGLNIRLCPLNTSRDWSEFYVISPVVGSLIQEELQERKSLYTRGWVLQEQLMLVLSSQILFYKANLELGLLDHFYLDLIQSIGDALRRKLMNWNLCLWTCHPPQLCQ